MNLSQDQIHVWKLNLDQNELSLDHLYKEVLSEDEKNRADRLKSDSDKKRSIYSRGSLRKKLSTYLDVDPREITFSYNKYGKPFLNKDCHGQDLQFNVSHSRNIILYAITKNREIGIDVEYLKRVKSADKIVERFFSEEERNFYFSQSESKKEWAFFTLWTRKEAYSKALGRGIGMPARDFDLSLVPELNDSGPNNGPSRWKLYNIEMGTGYLAAVATEGENIEIKHRN